MVKRSMRDLPVSRPFLLTVVFTLLFTSYVASQNAPSPQAPKRPTSTPYTGDLSIFESPGREQRLQISRVMDILGITAGKSVADIGAGSGWFAVRAARRVGGDGTVYAVDINPEAIKYIEDRVRKESISNVKTVLSHEDDPLLPANAVDAVLLLKTYHEVAGPVSLLEHLRPSLRQGARLGIIDRAGKGDDHGVDRATVVKEAAEAGFHLQKAYDFVKADGVDFFLVFTLR